MPELAKKVVSALNSSSLESDANVEMPIDRVMAFAVGAIKDPLGEALFMLKYMEDMGYYQRALALLARRATRPNESRNMMRRVCTVVLDEWYFDRCEVCGGRGLIVVDGTPHARHVCMSCEGSGRDQVSTQKRCRRLGVPVEAYPRWETRLARATRAIDNAWDRLWEEVGQQLRAAAPGRGYGKRERITLKVLASMRGKRILAGSALPAHNDNTMPGGQGTRLLAHNDNDMPAPARSVRG